MKIKIKLILGILLSVLSFSLGAVVKILLKKQFQVKKLENELEATRETFNQFQKIEEKANEDKKNLETGDINDSINESFNILRNVKQRKHSSKT